MLFPNLLSRRPLVREVWGLAIPVAIQSALVSALGMADVLMVSHLGSEAVAAVGLGSKINFVFILLMAALGTGCSILVAQYWGAGRQDRVRHTLALSILAGTLFMLPLTLLVILNADQLIMLGTDNSQVIMQGSSYLTITAFTLWLTQIVIIYEAALRATGDSKTPLYYATFTIGLNIILNVWLINGGLGVPAMGVAGAALATLLARMAQVMWMFFGQQRQSPRLHLSRRHFSEALTPTLVKRYGSMSWPLLVNFTLWSIGSLSYHLIAGRLGTTPLAVMSLLSPIESMYHSFFFGVTNACSIMIGQRLGRGQFAEARALAKGFMIFAPLGSFGLGLILLALSPFFLPLIGNLDAETLRQTQWAFAIMCLGFWLKVFNMVSIQGILRSGGDTKFCLYLDMSALWFVGLPLTLAAAFWWQLPFTFVYAMILAEEGAKALGNIWRVRQQKWVRNLTAGDAPDTALQVAVAG
ncbi:MATE family efflux transporter [Salinispirillum marinum]|uniref:Multidrug-efflux transporter n=2 Tax=Saccharospirillaceae TaxID=255527 RepID=A0ABV8B9D4_9GAMM